MFSAFVRTLIIFIKKGVYGSGEPLVIPFNDVPDILTPFLKVVMRTIIVIMMSTKVFLVMITWMIIMITIAHNDHHDYNCPS